MQKPSIIFIALTTALSIHSSVADQCTTQQDSSSTLANHTQVAGTAVLSVISTLNTLLGTWYPMNLEDHVNEINFTINGNNYTPLYDCYYNTITLKHISCNLTKALEIIFNPSSKPLTYQGHIFLSQKPVANYTIHYTNPTFSYFLNASDTSVKPKTTFQYQTYHINVQGSEADKSSISSFLDQLDQQIHTVVKSTLDQAVSRRQDPENYIKNILAVIREPTIVIAQKPSSYYHFTIEPTDSDVEVKYLVIEGLTHTESVTICPLSDTEYKLYGFQAVISNLTAYTDWQYRVNSTEQSTRTQFHIDHLTLEGKLKIFGKNAINITSVHLAPVTCQQFDNTVIETLTRNIEKIAQKSLYDFFIRFDIR